jgi:hypothetical protein
MSILNNTDFPIDPATTSGSDLAARLNRLANAFLTANGNPTRPNTIQADGLWVRQNVDGSKDLMMYTGTTDAVLSSVSSAGAAPSFRSNLNTQSITGNVTLGATHIENTIFVTGTTNTITLPLGSSVPAGTAIRLVNTASGIMTLQGQATDQIDLWGTLSASLPIGAGDNIEVISDGTNWKAIGGSATLAKSNGVLASGSGWMLLPKKKLLQWGTSVTNGSGLATVTLPVSYVDANYSAVANRVTTSVPTNVCVLALPYNLLAGSFQLITNNQVPAAQAGQPFRWMTIGDAP